ncbi:MAG TPA: hypothetical protein DCZ01_00315 [Elusimicrobia bacterium]|nr:MAG: hypothetical protein A2X37_08450 [Elusimicrobia bacterium GWA2_66_18]HAZ06976.1 hypothetical protein [Elusimicrobiota bacterium]
MSAELDQPKNVLLPIFLIVAVDILGMTMILPLLPFYAERYGASPQIVGLLTATYALCQLVAGPILGKLSDRYGRRPLLIVSQLGTFAGFLILGWARSLPLIFLSRFIDGITAGNLSLAQAYISDVTEPEHRAKSFGVIGIAFGLGFLIGPAMSGLLSQYDYSYPAWAAAGLSLTSVLGTCFLLPQARPHADEEAGPGGKRLGLLDWDAYAQYSRNKELAPVLVQFFCFCVMFSMFISGFALFAERRFFVDGLPFGPREVGYLYAYSGLLGVVIQGGLLGRMVEAFGESVLARAGFLCAAAGLAALALTGSLPMLIAVFTAVAFGTGVLRPVLTSLVTRSVSRREQGVVLGLTQSLNSTSSILAPLVSGFLIGHARLQTWTMVAATISATGFILGTWNERKKQLNRTGPIRALALVLVLALAAPAGAVRPLTPPAPEFLPDAAWINAKPLPLALLRERKVVVVAFLNLTSLNTLRALPVLKAWFDRYALHQLMVIGVLSADIEIHRSAAWARAQLRRLGVDFPVTLDSDRRLWNAYANEGWPALYLVNRKGLLVYDHLGEGGYAEFEKEMRAALADLVGSNALPAAVDAPEPPSKHCGRASADIPLGTRAKTAPLALDKNFSRRASMIVEAREGESATLGRWNMEPDGLRLTQANRDQQAFVRIVYSGAQALAVLAPPEGKKARFFIKQDDLWLHEGNAGKDVRFDDDGRSYVPVDTLRLYDISRDPAGRPHELYVIPDSKDAGIFGFSFADSCLAADLP